MVYIDAGADIRGRQRQYRYAMWRIWDDSKPCVMFIGLNPSTADAHTDDPTLVRCVNFARDWGYGGLYTGNLFAWRATDPRELRRAADAVGPDNDKTLRQLAARVDQVIAAWGNDGTYLDRSHWVRAMIANLYCLKINKSGEPAHPLYLKGGLKPIPLPSS